MSDMTPEKLREAIEQLDDDDGVTVTRCWAAMGAAADAWEADLWMRDHYKTEGDAFHALNESLHKRLEAAESALADILACNAIGNGDEAANVMMAIARAATDVKSSDEKDTPSTAHGRVV